MFNRLSWNWIQCIYKLRPLRSFSLIKIRNPIYLFLKADTIHAYITNLRHLISHVSFYLAQWIQYKYISFLFYTLTSLISYKQTVLCLAFNPEKKRPDQTSRSMLFLERTECTEKDGWIITISRKLRNPENIIHKIGVWLRIPVLQYYPEMPVFGSRMVCQTASYKYIEERDRVNAEKEECLGRSFF